MKKGEKEKDFKFNPANYDYMDNMPLEGWFWEIIRRTKEYEELFNEAVELEKTFKGLSNEYEKYEISHVEETIKLIDEGLMTPDDIDDTQRKIVCLEKTIRLNTQKLRDIGIEVLGPCPDCYSKGTKNYPYHLIIQTAGRIRLLAKPNIKYVNFHDGHTPGILGITPIKVFTCEECKNSKLHIDENPPPLCKILTIKKSEDTLFVGISRTATKTDIEKKVLPTIEKYLHPQKTKIRTDKWKYYLITYDLKNAGKEYREIADVLSQAYPDNKQLFDDRNIENYYKNALALINGEYKRYLHLTK